MISSGLIIWLIEINLNIKAPLPQPLSSPFEERVAVGRERSF